METARARVVRLTRESHIGGKQALPGRRFCHVITIDAGFQSIVTSNAKGESRKFIRNFPSRYSTYLECIRFLTEISFVK